MTDTRTPLDVHADAEASENDVTLFPYRQENGGPWPAEQTKPDHRAGHSVNITRGGGYADYKLICAAPATAICHAVFDCQCEEYLATGVENRLADAALRWFAAQRRDALLEAADAIERHRSQFGVGARALDMGRAWSAQFLRDHAGAPEPAAVRAVLGETTTEWGVRYENGRVSMVRDRENAEFLAVRPIGAPERTLVRREVSPWVEVPRG